MNQISNIPASMIVSMAVLMGLMVADLKIGDAVGAAVTPAIRSGSPMISEANITPANPSPNIDTNWFSGTNSQGVSYAVPSSQARKSDDDERIAVGGTMGESFSNNDDY